jgi:hypothetical protein
MLQDQVGGYYDPQTEVFFVLGDLPRSAASGLIAHELTHALDDQHFHIDRLLESANVDDDREAAAGCVIEGSATVVSNAFLLRGPAVVPAGPDATPAPSDGRRQQRFRALPDILQRSLISPYLLGQWFLLRGDLSRLRTGVTAADLDRAFADPPASTEQVLHPEKYWGAARDAPVAVALPDLSPRLGTGFHLSGDGVLGELGLAVLTGLAPLDPAAPEASRGPAWTNAAATGWGGDRYQLYEAGSRAVTLLATTWDTATDAMEFARALPASAVRATRRRDRWVVVVVGDSSPRDALADAALDALAIVGGN